MVDKEKRERGRAEEGNTNQRRGLEKGATFVKCLGLGEAPASGRMSALGSQDRVAALLIYQVSRMLQ